MDANADASGCASMSLIFRCSAAVMSLLFAGRFWTKKEGIQRVAEDRPPKMLETAGRDQPAIGRKWMRRC